MAPAPRSGGSGWIIGLVVAGVVMMLALVGAGAAFFLLRSKSAAISAAGDSANGEAWSDADASVPVSSRDPMVGSRAAPVTLVLFSDFQCPFCSKFEGTLAQVRQKYGAAQVRIIWKNDPLPFHTDARPAAIAAEAVFRAGGSTAFWKFHDSAFANQRELNQQSFEQWAAAAGVDLAKFRELQSDPSVAAKIDADIAEAKAVGVQGTPNTFINGFLLTGAQPLEKVTALVDAEISSAQRAIAAGTPADRVYARLSQENKIKNPTKKEETPEDEEKVWDVPAGKSPSRGPASAKVTIVEFADYQCPFCGRSESTLSQLQEIYGDKIRIVWKDTPLEFHKDAASAAELALEARAQKGDAAFWKAHDLLFKNQKALSSSDLEAYAAELHLDVARVRTAIRTEKHKADIAADQKLATDVTAKGTPVFFINGHKIVGAVAIDRFKSRIDKELAKL